jgi:DNA polymerase V
MKIVSIPKFSQEIENIPFRVDGEYIYAKFYEGGVQAGFPSPAEDFQEQRLSLDQKYITNPNATFIIKVKGDSMYPTLQKGDILVVKSDKALMHGKVAIISINHTDYTVKRFDELNKTFVADNESFGSIAVKDEDVVICLGVVEHLIRDL